MSIIKLDLGSGLKPREGYISVDAFVSADVNDDVRELSQFDNESVDEIYSSHTLEHISRRQVALTLSNWHRVLKNGGGIEIIVPDFPAVLCDWMKAYISGQSVWSFYQLGPCLDMIFGHQEHDGEYHKSGYDEGLLMHFLTEAGFVGIEINHINDHRQPCLKATARK